MDSAFLICGYPRSRTFWLANFFSIGGLCKCEHEALQYSSSSQEFWERAEQTCQEPIYGNSDSAAIFVLPALLARRPLTKVVWVDRPMPEVERSLHAAGFPFNKEAAALLQAYRDKHRDLFDLVVSFEKLGSLAVIQTLWRFLLGEALFDYGRWGLLERTKLAHTYEDYTKHPRGTKFLEFIA